MNTCLVLSLMGILLINGATSMAHTLMKFITSELPDVKEKGNVLELNGLQIYSYDSDSGRGEYKQDWVKKLSEEHAEFNYWMSVHYDNYYFFEDLIQIFNQTEEAHILQRMDGCEWDDETDEIKRYYQYGLDGEDFLSLDWDTETWVSAKPQTVISKERLERIVDTVVITKQFTYFCGNNLKRLVRSGESILNRTELPLVSLLQKSSSAPVTCHATGFYPDRAMLFWTKDGDQLYENVDPGEILPNNDGTFQMSVDLDVSSVPSEDWDRYQCVFQLSGVKEDLLTRLDKDHIRTNSERHEDRDNEKEHTSTIVAAMLAVLGVVLASVGVFLYRKTQSESKVIQEVNSTPLDDDVGSGQMGLFLRPGQDGLGQFSENRRSKDLPFEF